MIYSPVHGNPTAVQFRVVENKPYHMLYSVVVNSFPTSEMVDTFSIDGIDYKWMTIHEMQEDKNILKKNGDVISLVNEFIR